LGYLAIASVAFSLGGCVASSGILPTGYPDKFFINEMVAPFNGGGAAAYRIALNEADEFCRDHGRVLLIDHVRAAGDLRYPPTGSAVTFRCVLPVVPVEQQPKNLIDWPSAER
jgi:hypothetical protein